MKCLVAGDDRPVGVTAGAERELASHPDILSSHFGADPLLHGTELRARHAIGKNHPRLFEQSLLRFKLGEIDHVACRIEAITRMPRRWWESPLLRQRLKPTSKPSAPSTSGKDSAWASLARGIVPAFDRWT